MLGPEPVADSSRAPGKPEVAPAWGGGFSSRAPCPSGGLLSPEPSLGHSFLPGDRSHHLLPVRCWPGAKSPSSRPPKNPRGKCCPRPQSVNEKTEGLGRGRHGSSHPANTAGAVGGKGPALTRARTSIPPQPPTRGADTGGAAASAEGETEAGAGKGQTEFLLLAAGSLGESSEVATAAHARDSSGGVLTAGQVRLPSGRAPRGEGGRGGPRGPL